VRQGLPPELPHVGAAAATTCIAVPVFALQILTVSVTPDFQPIVHDSSLSWRSGSGSGSGSIASLQACHPATGRDRRLLLCRLYSHISSSNRLMAASCLNHACKRANSPATLQAHGRATQLLYLTGERTTLYLTHELTTQLLCIHTGWRPSYPVALHTLKYIFLKIPSSQYITIPI
jgi:hypothetical protein